MKQILLVGDKNSIFIRDFIKVLGREFDFILLNMNFEKKNTLSRYEDFYIESGVNIIEIDHIHQKDSLLKKIILIKKTLDKLDFDIVNIHYLQILHLPFALLNKKKKLIITIYGSDILRQKKKALLIQSLILRRADRITLETQSLIRRFNIIYNNRYSDRIIKLGVGDLAIDSFITYAKKSCNDKIEDKRYFGFPTMKTVIHLGYNARVEQQHLIVLDELDKLCKTEKSKIFLVLHCSYGGNNNYIEILREKCQKIGIESIIYEKFLYDNEMMIFRNTCDIFINVQTTDVMSSSMLEYLICGSFMIFGSWLEYDEIKNLKGIVSIDDISMINIELIKLLDKRILINNNIEACNNLMSWSVKKKPWISLFKSLG